MNCSPRILGVLWIVSTMLFSLPLMADDSLSAPGSYNLENPLSRFNLVNGTTRVSDYYRLTTDEMHKFGHLVSTTAICATEYKVTFQAYAGAEGANTGAVVGVFVTNNLYDQAGFNDIATGAISNPSLVRWNLFAGAVTYQDSGTPSDNYLLIQDKSTAGDTFFANSQNTSNVNTCFSYGDRIRQDNPAFRFKGSGYFNVTLHVSGDQAILTVDNGAGATSSVSTTVFVAPTKQFYVGFIGHTGGAHNEHRVRNPSIEIIQPGNCATTLSSDEVKAVLESACPGFQTSCNATCVENTLHSLWEEGTISYAVYDEYVKGCQSNLCDAAKEQSRLLGYEEGFADGLVQGFADGQEACTGDGDDQEQLSEEQVQEMLETNCPCRSARNKGEYVSCVTRFVNALRKQELITQDMRRDVRADALRSSCGKRSRNDSR